MITNSVIKLENVWKIYQFDHLEISVLKGVTLDISRGSFVVILGPSGSGKSTLLNMLGCLDLPTKGRVLLQGRDISKMSEDELAQARGKKIGFVFQQFNLLQNLNAVENVALPMIFQGKSETERKKRSESLLASLGLKERALHRPSELSGGEQQRIAIARALANDPEIIVADEPTGNLDSTTGQRIMEILINLHKNENKTIIVVTHDPTIADYSSQVVHIRDGEIATNHFNEGKILWNK